MAASNLTLQKSWIGNRAGTSTHVFIPCFDGSATCKISSPILSIAYTGNLWQGWSLAARRLTGCPSFLVVTEMKMVDDRLVVISP